MNVDLEFVEKFSKEMCERGIGNFETGFYCTGALEVIEHIKKQDEIIQKLINLVEHYGNCYNHDLTAYYEYRIAKKYMEDKNV